MKFPRIQSPCPLTPEQQRAIDGHCGHCDTQVYRLDAMDEAERRRLLAAARGPICVAYARPVRMGARLGAAMAASLASAVAMASPPQADAPPQSPVEQASLPQAGQGLDQIVVGGLDRPDAAEWSDADATQLDRIMLTGAVLDPAAAGWIDASDLPELPVDHEDAGAVVSAKAP